MVACAMLGLGLMGRAMATNLVAAGHRVLVYNRSPEPARELEAAGATVASSPAEAAADVEVVLVCLSDGAAVEQVVLGDAGVLAGARAGTVLVDLSTIPPDVARRVAEKAAAQDVAALDAPVSGGEQSAIDGTLSIMVGGDGSALARVWPVLEVLGTTVERVGPSGAGQMVKAANQLLVAGTYALVSEALLTLEASGVELEAAVRVLRGGLAGNQVLERRAGAMLDREFTPGARVDLHRKDLAIALELARSCGVAVPLTGIVAQLYEALAAQGHGGLDHSAVFKVLAQLAGRDTGG